MLLYTNVPKSKKRKVSKTVKLQHENWLKSIEKMTTNFSGKNTNKLSSPKKPFNGGNNIYRRETPYIKSKNPTDMSPCLKKEQNTYTGTNMIGIGTLHKSNAVPIFRVEDAQDMAKMRR